MKFAQNPRYAMQLGPVELLSRQGRGGVVARIACQQCGIHEEWGLGSPPEPSILKRHFITRGWEVAKKGICPDCQAKKKASKSMNTTKPQGVPAAQPAAKPTAAEEAKASEAAKRAKRMIYMALEDYYDEQKKCYKNGKSDKAIAAEVGASEAFVRQIRETDFGPIQPMVSVEDMAKIMSDMINTIRVAQTAWQYSAKNIADLAWNLDRYLSQEKGAAESARLRSNCGVNFYDHKNAPE